MPHSDFFNYLVSVTNNLSKRDHTEVACFLFVTHKNNMILDIPVLLWAILSEIIARLFDTQV